MLSSEIKFLSPFLKLKSYGSKTPICVLYKEKVIFTNYAFIYENTNIKLKNMISDGVACETPIVLDHKFLKEIHKSLFFTISKINETSVEFMISSKKESKTIIFPRIILDNLLSQQLETMVEDDFEKPKITQREISLNTAYVKNILEVFSADNQDSFTTQCIYHTLSATNLKTYKVLLESTNGFHRVVLMPIV